MMHFLLWVEKSVRVGGEDDDDDDDDYVRMSSNVDRCIRFYTALYSPQIQEGGLPFSFAKASRAAIRGAAGKQGKWDAG